MRWLPWLIVLLAIGFAVVFLRGTAADHPLADVPKPPLCALLEAAPASSITVRPVDAGSPLAGMVAGGGACDLLLGGARVGVLITTRRDLADRGDLRDTGVWLHDTISQLPIQADAVRGPWRRAVVLAPGHDVLIEDNGVIVKIAGAPDRESAIEAARRTAEALRAAPPPDEG